MNPVSYSKEKQGSARQRPYEKPGVITFGSVAKLTHGVGGTKVDHGQNANTKKGGA